jgi:hypothetical protein
LVFPQAFIFVCRHRLLFGFVLTRPDVLAMTHVGTGFFSFPAFASLRFFAGGLFRAIFKSF